MLNIESDRRMSVCTMARTIRHVVLDRKTVVYLRKHFLCRRPDLFSLCRIAYSLKRNEFVSSSLDRCVRCCYISSRYRRMKPDLIRCREMFDVRDDNRVGHMLV